MSMESDVGLRIHELRDVVCSTLYMDLVEHSRVQDLPLTESQLKQIGVAVKRSVYRTFSNGMRHVLSPLQNAD